MFNLSPEDFQERILEPYRTNEPIVLSQRTILPNEVHRFQVLSTADKIDNNEIALATFAVTHGHNDQFLMFTGGTDVSQDFNTKPSKQALQPSTAIELLCKRFHAVAWQMRQRYDGRTTLDVQDEYDVQDMMGILLRIFFHDVRSEEWTPDYASKSTKIDYYLPPCTVLETKKAHVSLLAQQLADQLVEDIAHYKKHPSCKHLFCFVYDPEGRIRNARGIESDFNGTGVGLEVKVIIAPEG